MGGNKICIAEGKNEEETVRKLYARETKINKTEDQVDSNEAN